jgi:hypothetical protein
MKAQANRYAISLAPTGRARCRACKGLVTKGAVRLVTVAVVSERPRRVTSFVRHTTCVNAALAALVLKASDGDADKVPVVGPVGAEEVEEVRAILRRGL